MLPNTVSIPFNWKYNHNHYCLNYLAFICVPKSMWYKNRFPNCSNFNFIALITILKTFDIFKKYQNIPLYYVFQLEKNVIHILLTKLFTH